MTTFRQTTQTIPFDLKARLKTYWQLIKSLQTGLLVITGVAGFVSARCPVSSSSRMLAMMATLFLAISGSTILNMVYDRDIDSKMKRTALRPLPSGRLDASEAQLVGLLLSWLGVGGAFALSPLFGLVVFAGLFLDVVVYTIWLKRRTAWSIVWGGVAGGMPVLAGRTLGTGQIELVGLLLALAVLLWIPTHILTYGIKHAKDYSRAGVPTFVNVYGEPATRRFISVSTACAAIIMAGAVWIIEVHAHCLYAVVSLGFILVGLAMIGLFFPSSRLNFGLFKFASVYMLASMALIIIGG